MLVRSIQEDRSEGKTVVEEAPKKVEGSNGIVERAVQEIGGRIRSVLWHKGEDGKVAYDKVKGRKPTVVGVEFGENIVHEAKRSQAGEDKPQDG
eukprot:1410629-Karenia_brevis.AAC.1